MGFMAVTAAQFKMGAGGCVLLRWVPVQYGAGGQKQRQAEIAAEAAAFAVQEGHQGGGGAGFAPHAVGNMTGETKQAGAERKQVYGVGVTGNPRIPPAQIAGQFPVFMLAEAGPGRAQPRSTAVPAGRVAGQVAAARFPADLAATADFGTAIKLQPVVGFLQRLNAAADTQFAAELYGPVLGNVVADMHQPHQRSWK